MMNVTSEERVNHYKKVFINDYARQFREIADRDYVAARQSFRAGLYPQFLWSAQQAIEKYLKCILLLNKIPITDKNGKVSGVHDLKTLLDDFKNGKPAFEIIKPASYKFIEHLDRSAMASRYLSAPVYVFGEQLMQLDGAVWDIRRYCKVLDYSIAMPDGTEKSFFKIELDKIEKSETLPPQKFSLDKSSFLEKVIEDKSHPARSFLIWKNNYFGAKVRRDNTVDLHSSALYPELFYQPDMVDEVSKYIFIPKTVKTYLEEETKNGQRKNNSKFFFAMNL